MTDREELGRLADQIEASNGLFTMHDDKPRQLGIRQSAVVIAALRRLAEAGTQSEPVAWADKHGETHPITAESKKLLSNNPTTEPYWSRFSIPLYTSPPAPSVAEKTGRVTVPPGQTPLDDKLGHRYLDVIKEGATARDTGMGSPYHGHSLEHCLHAAGWVSRDLRLALDKVKTSALITAPQDDVREALRRFNVEDYVASYEFRDICGEVGDHVPTDDERVLITDAIHGAIAEIEAALTAPGATTKSDGGAPKARDFSTVEVDENFYFNWPKDRAHEVQVQDGGGNETCSESEPLGKSKAALAASVDANANDDGRRVETGNNVVTGGESAATPPAPQAVEAVSVDTIARICADDLVPIIETATRVANRTGNTFVIDRQKVATMIAGHFNRALLAKFKMGVR